MSTYIDIAIAEDHTVVRQGYIALLKDYPGIRVVVEAANGKELIQKLKQAKPQIVLLDIDMPVMNGDEALDKIKLRFPKIKIIIFTAFFGDYLIPKYKNKGANSLLPKDCNIDKLVDVIYKVNEKGTYFDAEVLKTLAEKDARSKNLQSESNVELTSQQIEIIEMICNHLSSKEIADRLGITKKTVDYHRSNIGRLTKCEKVTELMMFAVKNGIIKNPG